MRRLLLFALPALLLCAGVALAGGPRRAIRSSDQERARAMLLRKADLPGSGQAQSNALGPGANLACLALDESDLTLTGEARSPAFVSGLAFFVSEAQVYASAADARTSWRRAVSPAGLECLRNELRRELESNGLKLVSLRRSPFPRLAAQTVAYRIVLSGPTQAGRAGLVLDVVGLMYSRAQASIAIGSAGRPEPRTAEIGLARLVAGRMSRALRGA